jgi:hypothetical protein
MSINRNIRLHLRNDRKTVQKNFALYQEIHDIHFYFYCTLSRFNQWNHTRQILPHDRTLIRQLTATFRQGGNIILRLGQLPGTQPSLQMMTGLLVQHVKRTLTIAESGTLVHRPIMLTYSWQSPLNQARMGHFCNHLHHLLLLQDPLTTPNFTEPNLDVDHLQSYGDIVTDILAEAEANLSAMN